MVKKSSCINSEWPFIDDRGTLRSRGQIGADLNIAMETKFPIILPKENAITILIVDWFHRRCRHANREAVVNKIRKRFDIPTLEDWC